MKAFTIAAHLLAVSALSLSFTSQAALVGRDLDGNLATFEAYYDTDQDITWLADANYAKTSGYDADGKMLWANANTWANGLTLGGYTDWRLADTVDVGNDGGTFISIFEGVDIGYNITTHSEMSYMFYETLGNLAFFDTAGNSNQPGWGLMNTGPFSNLLPSFYWSATEYVPSNHVAWLFHFYVGSQDSGNKTAGGSYAWAVHSGDVGASAVPVPATMWLFGSALLGMMGIKRKR